MGTVVVRAKKGSGGTWAGAREALTKNLCPVFVWDNPLYDGNQELIRLSAFPLSDEGRLVRK